MKRCATPQNCTSLLGTGNGLAGSRLGSLSVCVRVLCWVDVVVASSHNAHTFFTASPTPPLPISLPLSLELVFFPLALSLTLWQKLAVVDLNISLRAG